jgi:hypothetical protein
VDVVETGLDPELLQVLRLAVTHDHSFAEPRGAFRIQRFS